MKCPNCGGSGWNPSLKRVDKTIPVPVGKSLAVLKKGLREILLCPVCGGKGTVQEKSQ